MAVPRVIPCFHSYGQAPTQFAIDLSKALRFSGTFIPYVIHEQGCYVESSRNKLVRAFLKSDGTHMMMIDVDISFESDAFLKTFTIFEQTQSDVLYGNYVLGNSANSLFGGPNNKSQESAVMVNLKPNMVYDGIATGGTGWVMLRRNLLERMEKECPGPWHWFARDLTSDGTDYRGEDISFGLRVYNMVPKPKVLGTTAVFLRHLKVQPFIPQFMNGVSKDLGVPSVSFPNPYEGNPNFLISGNHVIEKKSLTPDQLAQIEMQILAQKVEEEKNAQREREAAKVHGSGASEKEKGKENQDWHVGEPTQGLRQEAGADGHAKEEVLKP